MVYCINYVTIISPAKEYLEQSNYNRCWWLIAAGITLIAILVIAIIVYRTYRNKILKLPLTYNDQFMDSTALRTGTYTVDHLKLATIVGMSLLSAF